MSFYVKAGVNMYYLSDRLNEVRTKSVAGRKKIEYYLRKSSKSPFIGNRCVREHLFPINGQPATRIYFSVARVLDGCEDISVVKETSYADRYLVDRGGRLPRAMPFM